MSFVRMALLVGAMQVVSAAQDFTGRWGLTAFDRGQPKAWWLEVSPGQTGKGKFMGAPNGQVDELQDITVQNGELLFTEDKKGWRAPDGSENAVFTALLVNGQLEGVFSLGDAVKVKWTGKRAPVIPDQDDGSWREGTSIQLFNGKDLSGWRPLASVVVLARPRPVTLAESGWSAHDGILSTEGKGMSVATEGKFWNYLLHIEFRVSPGGNSGIGLRGRYEVQIINDDGRPVNGHSTGGVYGRLRASVNASKPAGEWQTYDIRLVGRWVTIVFNGIKVVDKGEIEGPTAIAIDSNEDDPGPLCLQGDHGAVDFRNIVLTPLVK